MQLYCNLHYLALDSSREEKAMSRAVQRKDHPLSLRLPESDLAIIDRAAELRGRSRTEFMRDAAVRAAEDAIMENRVIRLDAESFAAFVAELDRPGAPVPEMVELFKRRAPWDRDAG
jgi:uncharacterized protein (DUF1778 family)